MLVTVGRVIKFWQLWRYSMRQVSWEDNRHLPSHVPKKCTTLWILNMRYQYWHQQYKFIILLYSYSQHMWVDLNHPQGNRVHKICYRLVFSFRLHERNKYTYYYQLKYNDMSCIQLKLFKKGYMWISYKMQLYQWAFLIQWSNSHPDKWVRLATGWNKMVILSLNSLRSRSDSTRHRSTEDHVEDALCRGR